MDDDQWTVETVLSGHGLIACPTCGQQPQRARIVSDDPQVTFTCPNKHKWTKGGPHDD